MKATLIIDMPECCGNCLLMDDDPSGGYCIAHDDDYIDITDTMGGQARLVSSPAASAGAGSLREVSTARSSAIIPGWVE